MDVAHRLTLRVIADCTVLLAHTLLSAELTSSEWCHHSPYVHWTISWALPWLA